METAGILVIGNEVLSGKVEEQNGRFLMGALREMGVRVDRVVLVRDDAAAIVEEVQRMSAQYDHVFTSGGVGGTHDDITMPAVARAFGLELVPHPALLAMLEAHFGEGLTAAHQRLALVPDGAVLHSGEGVRVPAVRVRNVFVLPGAPDHLRAKLPAIRPLLNGRPIWLGEIFLAVDEELLAETLATADVLRDDVEVGSYPRFDGQADHRVKVTIEGPSELACREVLDYLLGAWKGTGFVVRVAEPRHVGGPSA